jgi:hypothetical protein
VQVPAHRRVLRLFSALELSFDRRHPSDLRQRPRERVAKSRTAVKKTARSRSGRLTRANARASARCYGSCNDATDSARARMMTCPTRIATAVQQYFFTGFSRAPSGARAARVAHRATVSRWPYSTPEISRYAIRDIPLGRRSSSPVQNGRHSSAVWRTASSVPSERRPRAAQIAASTFAMICRDCSGAKASAVRRSIALPYSSISSCRSR